MSAVCSTCGGAGAISFDRGGDTARPCPSCAGGGCPWADCWCRAWPPVRVVVSTGQRYTFDELPADGPARLFRYSYPLDQPRAAEGATT